MLTVYLFLLKQNKSMEQSDLNETMKYKLYMGVIQHHRLFYDVKYN